MLRCSIDFELIGDGKSMEGKGNMSKQSMRSVCAAITVGIGHPLDVYTDLGEPPEDHTESRQHSSNSQMAILSP